ncbi:signal peptidase II [Candidatus Pelagibacter bacterium]|nr:signal peptidase II [Candidatus Pelagibacter bacterium]MDA9619029.1 signal peptidase II [Candidatus Pelagibacter bacterium]
MNLFINSKEIKNYFLKKENIFYLFFILIIFFFDRLSKREIINNLNESIYFINDYINFNLIWNIGIGFGFLSTDSFLFYNLVTFIIGVVIIFLIYIFAKSQNLDKLIYSIIIGGALGNFYDRLVYRAVPDFIDIHYHNFHWFTFNVADIFITIGVIIFLTKSFFVKDLNE